MSNNPDQKVLRFPNTAKEDAEALKAQLRNMYAVLARHHGPGPAHLMLAEAALAVVAEQALAANCVVATRFALEIEADHAFGMGTLTGNGAVF